MKIEFYYKKSGHTINTKNFGWLLVDEHGEVIVYDGYFIEHRNDIGWRVVK